MNGDHVEAEARAELGWTFLRSGDASSATEHFAEALRLDPTLDAAREGLAASLTRRPTPRAFLLRTFRWMARQGGGPVLGFAVAGLLAIAYFGNRLPSTPNQQSVEGVLILIFFLLAALVWLADPLTYLLLRLDPVGQLALLPDQRTLATLIAACLIVGAAALGLGLLAGNIGALALASVSVLLVAPVAATFRVAADWRRRVMAGATALVAALGAGGSLLLAVAPTGRGQPLELLEAGAMLWAASVAGSLFAPHAARLLSRLRGPRRQV